MSKKHEIVGWIYQGDFFNNYEIVAKLTFDGRLTKRSGAPVDEQIQQMGLDEMNNFFKSEDEGFFEFAAIPKAVFRSQLGEANDQATV